MIALRLPPRIRPLYTSYTLCVLTWSLRLRLDYQQIGQLRQMLHWVCEVLRRALKIGSYTTGPNFLTSE